eukprot:CAMPEP_0172518068 /NCGR_PEP_ID=MMETSP1066-20121228/290236_1 /TAXON_ID=671091 /ORGANISM="Coscinodiscus wailesii, Strain CCMP2513" /LENGTH=1365 /DNA_ID=CAMNT_0013300363 /DNA_START=216 /DNA_END=4313 /DNA_ORIENTATION=-
MTADLSMHHATITINDSENNVSNHFSQSYYRKKNVTATSNIPTKLSKDKSQSRSSTLIESWNDAFEETDDFSEDTYTFMLFNPPQSPPFIMALIVCTIQVAIFIFIIVELTDFENSRNPLGVPPDVSKEVRACQGIALIIATFTQEDVRTSIILIHDGYLSLRIVRAFSGQVTLPKYIASISCRLLMGVVGLLATLLLIITESSVLDLFLTFTAIGFVSRLDDLTFILCTHGYFGKYMQRITQVVSEAFYVKLSKRRLHKNWALLLLNNKSLMVLILGSMFIAWGVIGSQQMSGSLLCDTVYVQFGDEFLPLLGTFSGHYDRTGHSYEERRSRDIQSDINFGIEGIAKFVFCHKHKFWAFNIHPTMSIDNKKFDPCDWLVRSEETTFSHLPLLASLRWFVRKGKAREGILQHMSITCLDCKNDDYVCGEDGTCDNENKCVCKDGWYGIRCDFPFPCQKIEIDIRFKKFLGVREFSTEYSLLHHDQSDPDQIVEVYDRPVYIYEHDKYEGLGFDVMIFTGRRWVLFHTREAQNTSHLVQMLSNNFHVYWSDWWKTSIKAFISDPLDIGSPHDAVTPIGVKWYKVKTEKDIYDNKYGTLAAESTSIDVALLCTACNNQTNPCFYNGVCNAKSQNNTIPASCQCSLGSLGSLCQIPPVGDGKCDQFFNIPALAYDGGDCCEETCRSTSEYSCGEGVVGEENGILAFGQIGYSRCIDPVAISMISGSRTLFDIIKRGYVKCRVTSNLFVQAFEVNLCKAIAAAALNNSNSIKLYKTMVNQRFIDLANENFDVMFRATTFTAQRDIFEPTAETGFTFSASPYLYDGLKYGGIPPFGSCADNLDWSSPQCLDLKICVEKGSTWHATTTKWFPKDVIVTVDSDGSDTEIQYLNKGLCNCFAGESTSFILERFQAGGFRGSNLEVGQNIFSKEPLTAVTRQNDRIWSKFVSWVIEALIQAEQFNITKAAAKNNGLASTFLFGPEFTDMFNNAIAANGNYGELYEKDVERYIPRGTGLNNINKGNTALLYPFPFGKTDTQGPDPTSGGTIERIFKRGTMNCGVRNNMMGFATEDPMTLTWIGFHADLCKGIASALFDGAVNVRIIPVIPSSRFSMLQNGVIDILVAGVSHTLKREIKEPTTGKGFDFTPTYFYDGMRFAGPTPYGICADRLIFDNTTFSPDCPRTKICVVDSTTWLDTMKNSLKIPDASILAVATMDVVYDMLASGKCNAIAGESVDVAKMSVIKRNYPPDADYYIGENKHTLERLAIVSRSDDAQFSDFIRWLVFGLFYAAEENIKQETYYNMPGNVLLFGDFLSGMWQNMIKAIGNYDELFERNLNGIINRDGANFINLKSGPQFYANVGVKKQGDRTELDV